VESVIKLTETPQRADIKAEYTINGDILTVKIEGNTEVFDFTGLPDGQAEGIEIDSLPINPIVSVKKENDVIDVVAIRFYDADEKAVFENG
jgi:hypothetical protein